MADRNRTALRISLVAIMAAVVAVFTMVIRIPSPIGGYISLCDAAVVFSAYAFGPLTGFIAGGLGSAFADLLGGYPQFALIQPTQQLHNTLDHTQSFPRMGRNSLVA